MPEGPSKGYIHPLGEMLPLYYKVRGWDEKGVPTAKKKEALGL
jgi:aldehyde:ferredoxin oxidoreductase